MRPSRAISSPRRVWSAAGHVRSAGEEDSVFQFGGRTDGRTALRGDEIATRSGDWLADWLQRSRCRNYAARAVGVASGGVIVNHDGRGSTMLNSENHRRSSIVQNCCTPCTLGCVRRIISHRLFCGCVFATVTNTDTEKQAVPQPVRDNYNLKSHNTCA